MNRTLRRNPGPRTPLIKDQRNSLMIQTLERQRRPHRPSSYLLLIQPLDVLLACFGDSMRLVVSLERDRGSDERLDLADVEVGEREEVGGSEARFGGVESGRGRLRGRGGESAVEGEEGRGDETGRDEAGTTGAG